VPAPDPAVFAAGATRVETVVPLTEHRVAFDGPAHVLADPWAMTDPKAALSASPVERCEIELHVHATAPAQAFSLDAHGDFTPHHFDQFVATSGTVRLGDEVHRLEAHGMRDHGWGPRSWDAPTFYRWLFGSCGGFGFAAGVLGRDGDVASGGFVWEGGDVWALDRATVKTTYTADAVESIRLELIAGGRSWALTGRAQNAIPLRHRHPSGPGFTRILESSVLWAAGEHRMLGIAEYLDQSVDGRLSGVDAYDTARP
jgi:hypothetical protein